MIRFGYRVQPLVSEIKVKAAPRFTYLLVIVFGVFTLGYIIGLSR